MRKFFVCVALLAAGCGKGVQQEKILTLEEVPEAAMTAAKKAMKEKFPDVKFERVSLRPNGIYEISGKSKNGKVHDVEVTAEGQITEVE